MKLQDIADRLGTKHDEIQRNQCRVEKPPQDALNRQSAIRADLKRINVLLKAGFETTESIQQALKEVETIAARVGVGE